MTPGARWSRALAGVGAALVLTSCAARARPRPALAEARPAASALTVLAADVAAITGGQPRATWGIAVRSLRSGESLLSHNAAALLVPGSVSKIPVAAGAAAAVGWDYAFVTTVEGTGPVEAGVLHGDVVIRGSGDPSLQGDGGVDLSAALVEALLRRGVRRIAGRVVADDNALEEPRPGLAWSWDDLGTVSGTLVGGVNLGENVTRIQVSPGPAAGAPARLAPPADDPDFVLHNESLTGPPGSPRTIWAERRPGTPGLTVAGSLAADAPPGPLAVSVGNPTAWAARVVRTRLVAAGIDVAGPAVDLDDVSPVSPGDVLVTVTSRPLRELVRPMLKRSINLYAEALLRVPGGVAGRDAAAGIAALRPRLTTWGVPDGAMRLVDGSGLSRFNLASADALVAVLAAHWEGGASPLVDALPVAGVDGTLATRLRGTPAAGNLRGKTGTMTHVRSLAGYVTSADGEPLAFAILVNNFEGSPAAVTAAVDAVAARLAAFRR